MSFRRTKQLLCEAIAAGVPSLDNPNWAAVREQVETDPNHHKYEREVLRSVMQTRVNEFALGVSSGGMDEGDKAVLPHMDKSHHYHDGEDE